MTCAPPAPTASSSARSPITSRPPTSRPCWSRSSPATSATTSATGPGLVKDALFLHLGRSAGADRTGAVGHPRNPRTSPSSPPPTGRPSAPPWRTPWWTAAVCSPSPTSTCARPLNSVTSRTRTARTSRGFGSPIGSRPSRSAPDPATSCPGFWSRPSYYERLRACLLDIERFLLIRKRDQNELLAYWVRLGDELILGQLYLDCFAKWERKTGCDASQSATQLTWPTNWVSSSATRDYTLRPNPCIDGRWRATSRPWGRRIPTHSGVSTTWPSCCMPKATWPGPSPYSGGRWRAASGP